METNSLAISNKSLIVSEPTLQARHTYLSLEMLAALIVPQHPGVAFALFGTITVAFIAAIAIPYIVLTHLFNLILNSALYVWASNPPANQVVLEAGNLRMEFGCTLEPVPWEFIAAFAASRRDAVARGFMGVFDKEWWFQRNGTGRAGRLAGRLCYVGMRIVEEGRVVVPPMKG